MGQINNVSEEYRMKRNTNMTKVMVVSKNSNKDITVRINSKFLETSIFSHMGCTLNNKWDHSV